jgi:hypothetical protein
LIAALAERTRIVTKHTTVVIVVGSVGASEHTTLIAIAVGSEAATKTAGVVIVIASKTTIVVVVVVAAIVIEIVVGSKTAIVAAAAVGLTSEAPIAGVSGVSGVSEGIASRSTRVGASCEITSSKTTRLVAIDSVVIIGGRSKSRIEHVGVSRVVVVRASELVVRASKLSVGVAGASKLGVRIVCVAVVRVSKWIVHGLVVVIVRAVTLGVEVHARVASAGAKRVGWSSATFIRRWVKSSVVGVIATKVDARIAASTRVESTIASKRSTSRLVGGIGGHTPSGTSTKTATKAILGVVARIVVSRSTSENIATVIAAGWVRGAEPALKSTACGLEGATSVATTAAVSWVTKWRWCVISISARPSGKVVTRAGVGWIAKGGWCGVIPTHTESNSGGT